MRGRKPKPTALKILEGNPGKRPLPKYEPKPKGVPKCPLFLEKAAKKEWRRIVKELSQIEGMLTAVDQTALAAYCQAYARWMEAEKVLSEHGTTYQAETKYGFQLMARPEVAISRTALQQVRAFCSEFGLTPSSRGRMSLKPEKEGDEFEDDFS